MALPRTLTIAATSGLALLVVAGCGQLAQRRLDYSATEKVKIDQIRIEPGSGDVVVRTGAVSDLKIDRIVRYHGDQPDNATYRLEGTALILDTDCGRQCSVSYDVLAPTGVTVTGRNGSGNLRLDGVTGDVRVGSGDITINGPTGPVKAETGSGNITVTDGKGSVSVHTGSGDVTGRGLGGEVTADTGSGNIQLTLGTPASVRAKTGSGDVDLSVPTGHYQVRVQTGSGSKDLQVPNDPSATLLLDVRTGSGNIKIS